VEITSYSDLLKRTCALAQRVYSELSNDDSDLLMVYIDQRFKQIWEYYDWPDIKRIEKRYFRPLYAAALNYDAGYEVYYPSEKKYYQTLKTTQGNAPTSTAHWAESKQSYSADSWVSGTTYAVGDTVLYDVDGLYYACHTAHTAGANLGSNWGVLTELDKYVAWEQTGENKIGDVLEVWDYNPRTNNKAAPQAFYQSENGVQVISGPNIVYVEYRQQLPSLFFTTWATGSDYDTNDVVRFPATGAEFDLYKATSDHTASGSNDPKDSGAPWDLIQIPRDFSAYIAHGAASSMLQTDEKEQLALAQEQYSERALMELLDRVERQEQQQKEFKVLQR